MKKFTVRETITLIRYIEAENEADALKQIRDMSSCDFDEVDCSMPEAITITQGHGEEWSGSPCPDDPDNFWIDDETGERRPAE